jgi:iron(III) transport system permease protein
LVLGLAFILPVGQLLAWCAADLARDLGGEVVGPAWHALFIAGGGAGLVVAAALTLSLAKRHHPGAAGLLVRFATMGYALPGAVLALGILVPVAALDNSLAGMVKAKFDFDLSSLLGAGLGMLLLAYLVRFLGLGFGLADRAWQRVTPNLVEAARSLGVHGLALWREVHWPLLRGGLLGAFLLAFVEIMRELPIILLLRPAGWDTLAVRVFEMAQAGQWQRAALPSLLLVLAGLPQILFLARGAEHRHGHA